MTNKELLIQLLHEATHQGKELLTLKVETVIRDLEIQQSGSTVHFAKVFSPEEAALHLAEMRRSQVAIVDWFMHSYAKAIQHANIEPLDMTSRLSNYR